MGKLFKTVAIGTSIFFGMGFVGMLFEEPNEEPIETPAVEEQVTEEQTAEEFEHTTLSYYYADFALLMDELGYELDVPVITSDNGYYEMSLDAYDVHVYAEATEDELVYIYMEMNTLTASNHFESTVVMESAIGALNEDYMLTLPNLIFEASESDTLSAGNEAIEVQGYMDGSLVVKVYPEYFEDDAQVVEEPSEPAEASEPVEEQTVEEEAVEAESESYEVTEASEPVEEYVEEYVEEAPTEDLTAVAEQAIAIFDEWGIEYDIEGVYENPVEALETAQFQAELAEYEALYGEE